MQKPLLYQQDLEQFCAVLGQPPGMVVETAAGRGAYTQAFLQLGYRVYALGLTNDDVAESTPPPGPDAWTVKRLPPDLDQALIPHRTCVGIWATDSLRGLDARMLAQRLSLFADWLLPQGVAAFVVQEGEGMKRVTWHGQGVRAEQSVYLYQPRHVEEIVHAAGLRTLDAWRAGSVENATIHVLAQRP